MACTNCNKQNTPVILDYVLTEEERTELIELLSDPDTQVSFSPVYRVVNGVAKWVFQVSYSNPTIEGELIIEGVTQ